MQHVDTHDKNTGNNKSQLLKQSWAFGHQQHADRPSYDIGGITLSVLR